ncbi:unnamed protein product [Heligmosomoides polygyrus]|uniref:Uncharacterized protein n=1 Tax=Heligmosomoides polygyrus TaxID=6339 RepID=A0A3P8AKQ3_HELPZ|nr:unnamed protein product [Heligmosomoides polygyrus]
MECWRRQKPADDVRRVWGCLGYKDELIPSDDVWGAFIDRTMSVRVAELICPASCSRVASSGIADNFGGGPEYLTPSTKVQFVSKVVGETDHFKRSSYYLDGLEKCNNIDREWTDHVQDEALRYGNVENAVWLEKAGMKEFTALFMTLPPFHMDRIAKAACAKHERQLTCGAEYEGVETTRKRITDLKKIGNHKMMFDKECGDTSFVTRVYPCVGRDVSSWIRPCAEQVDQYSAVRDSVNQRISSTYDAAVAKVKNSDRCIEVEDEEGIRVESEEEDPTREERKGNLDTFERAMSSIAFLEGSKCGLFKQMRVCVLRRLLENCGVEAMKAFNTSISLGYLRTERRERLNLDFQVCMCEALKRLTSFSLWRIPKLCKLHFFSSCSLALMLTTSVILLYHEVVK